MATQMPTRADFEALLNEQLGGAGEDGFEGRVVKGTVTAIENGFAVIDVGLKTEGRIALKEFSPWRRRSRPDRRRRSSKSIVDRVENAARRGHAQPRPAPAAKTAWDKLESATSAKASASKAAIFGRVKGGFTVDLGGAVAFLPGCAGRYPPGARCRPADGQVLSRSLILKMDRRPRQHRCLAPCDP